MIIFISQRAFHQQVAHCLSLQAPLSRVTEIPDLVALDGTLMSDGCGVIRDSILAIVCANRGIRRDTHCKFIFNSLSLLNPS